MCFPIIFFIIEEDEGSGHMRKNMLYASVLLLLMLTGCQGQGTETSEAVRKRVEIGETISTAWFDYTIVSVEELEQDAFEEIEVTEGNQLLSVAIKLKSTYYKETPMSRYDFQIYWDHMEDTDERCFALAAVTEEQLPDTYELDAGETWEGTLLYLVPEDQDRYVLVFQEHFDDGTQQGDVGTSYGTFLQLNS